MDSYEKENTRERRGAFNFWVQFGKQIQIANMTKLFKKLQMKKIKLESFIKNEISVKTSVIKILIIQLENCKQMKKHLIKT